MNSVLMSLLGFLGCSILFYVILGGADFGAGILDGFLGPRYRKEQRELISHAMAPVWEANHVWLILVVVILFMGFPKVYTLIAVYLHLPLLAVLLGIVARGCAFTFRYYDTLDSSYSRAFNRTFFLSSVWTSFFLGVLAASTILGRIHPQATQFYDLYVFPWLNSFSIVTGVFTCCLFSFLAAVFLVGETSELQLKKIFIRKAAALNVCIVAIGVLVFWAAQASGYFLLQEFLANTLSMTCFILATLLWVPFWWTLKKVQNVFVPRLLGASIVSLVLLGGYAVQFPTAIRIQQEGQLYSMSFIDFAAPESTQRALLGALIVGSLVIFPSLIYLFKVFKWKELDRTL